MASPRISPRRRRISAVPPISAFPTPPIRSACSIARARASTRTRNRRREWLLRAAQEDYLCGAGRIWHRCCSMATACPPTRQAGRNGCCAPPIATIPWRRTASRACYFAGRGLKQDRVEGGEMGDPRRRGRPARSLARQRGQQADAGRAQEDRTGDQDLSRPIGDFSATCRACARQDRSAPADAAARGGLGARRGQADQFEQAARDHRE